MIDASASAVALGLLWLTAACGNAPGTSVPEPIPNGGSGGSSAALAGAPPVGGAASGAGGTTSPVDGATSGIGGGAGALGQGGESGSAGAAGEPVRLPAGVVSLFPLPGATGLCSDPALRLGFSKPPKLGNSGKLRVLDDEAAVVTIDFGRATVDQTIGGQTFHLPRQVYVEGNEVVIPLASKALGHGKRYSVTIEAGAIQPGGDSFSITEPLIWSFETLAAPASGSRLGVALDGSAPFCSLQGALDAIPEKNSAPVSIDVARGTYHGVVYFRDKHAISVRGADRKSTIISGLNNNELNPGGRGRALVGADHADGLVIEDLSIVNVTPQGGSQAEALRLQDCDRCTIRRSDISSLQDTLLWSGRLYAEDCLIAGNVDFIWGDGVAYFDRCEIKTVGRSGVNVQSRNGANGYGYVFVDSKLTSDPGISESSLARVDVSQYPHSHVAYVDCTLGSHISKAGFTISGGAAPASLRFWEYRSKNEAGALLDVSGRVAGVQISAEQAALMRDPEVVLGGWRP